MKPGASLITREAFIGVGRHEDEFRALQIGPFRVSLVRLVLSPQPIGTMQWHEGDRLIAFLGPSGWVVTVRVTS